MIFISLLMYKLKRTVSALCGLVIISYASFFLLYYTPYEGDFYTAIDCLRISAIMIFVMSCGLKSDKPITYLIYSLILLANLVVDFLWMFANDFYIIADPIYLTIATMELIIFGVGTRKTLKIKSRKPHVTFHLDNTGGLNSYWYSPISGDNTIQKGSRKWAN